MSRMGGCVVFGPLVPRTGQAFIAACGAGFPRSSHMRSRKFYGVTAAAGYFFFLAAGFFAAAFFTGDFFAAAFFGAAFFTALAMVAPSLLLRTRES
jgi:hypothetical protein